MIGRECLALQTAAGELRSAIVEGRPLPNEMQPTDVAHLERRVALLGGETHSILLKRRATMSESAEQRKARLLHEQILKALEKMRRAQEEHEEKVRLARQMRYVQPILVCVSVSECVSVCLPVCLRDTCVSACL